jgi:adenylate cyclase
MAAERIDRQLAAIFAADVAGYSRLMSADEAGTLKALTEQRVIMDRLIATHAGRIANTAGDSVMAEFPSVVDAVQCAVDVQQELASRNNGRAAAPRLDFRIGVHVGEVMRKDGDIFGDGVNIAARLQDLADPGGLCISGSAHEYVRKSLPIAFTDRGPQSLKNIPEPVRVFALAPGRAQGAAASFDAGRCALALPGRPSIAVLAFANLSGDPEQEYLADGIADEILTALSRFRELFVIARTSSFTYKGKAVDVRQIGRELGVRYVLEGSVRKAGGRLRITGQLIDATAACRSGAIASRADTTISSTCRIAWRRPW